MRKLITILFMTLTLHGLGQDKIPDSDLQPFFGTRLFVSLDGNDTLALDYNEDTLIWVTNNSLNYRYIKDTLLAYDYQGTWKGLDTSDITGYWQKSANYVYNL